MLQEAERMSPLETGGVLMGYWGRDVSQVVVTAVIGPGSSARHKRLSFDPDTEYQERRIAQRYLEWGGTEMYLGDWHTHPWPGVHPGLSRVDRETLTRVARYAEARVPQPIMAVLSKTKDDGWSVVVWQLVMHRCGPFVTRRPRVLSAIIE
jgi:integrative and conjugative element protein (TIGR02256 family)